MSGSKLIQRVWDWAVGNYPVPIAATKANEEWRAQRGKFTQWPPAPDEVEAGVGGGVTPGVSRDQLEVLGELWMQIPGNPAMYKDTATDYAVERVANRFGWNDITVPRQLDPDQYYTARHWLREWVRLGHEPDWPTPSTVDHNALDRDYQKAVAEVNRPWVAPAQPQGEPPITPPAPIPVTQPSTTHLVALNGGGGELPQPTTPAMCAHCGIKRAHGNPDWPMPHLCIGCGALASI